MRISSVRKSRRVCRIMAILVTLAMLLTFVPVWADSVVTVQWCGEEGENPVYLPEGDFTAKVTNAPQEGTLFLAVYDGDMLESCVTAPIQPGGDAQISTTVSASADCAKLFLWDMKTLSPLAPVLGELRANPFVYRGFAGIYQNIYMNGHKLREQNEKLVADSSDPGDMSDQFLPRDMGDGSYAFEVRSSNQPYSGPYDEGYNGFTRRIGAASAKERLPMSRYCFSKVGMADNPVFEGMNDNTQHWICEKSKEYTASQPSYYLRNLENGQYIGLSEDGSTVIAVNEDEKALVTFEPLKEESPLYMLSKTKVYGELSDWQRARLERVYESVAGDVFELSGDAAATNETPRGRLDALYEKIKGMEEWKQSQELRTYILGLYVTKHPGSTYHISHNLPETEGVTVTHGEEQIRTGHPSWYGWTPNSTKRFRVYNLTVTEADGSDQQVIEVWVAVDNDTATTNAERFEKIIGEISQIYRSLMKTMLIETDSKNSFWSSGEHLYIRTTGTESENGILDSLVHELGHSLDWRAGTGGTWWTKFSDEWANAQERDLFSMSSYGTKQGQLSEDFAEFCRFYFACYGNRDRQRALQILCPNRYKLFKQILEEHLDHFSLWEDGITVPEN